MLNSTKDNVINKMPRAKASHKSVRSFSPIWNHFHILILSLALISATVVAYWPVRNAGFIWDDDFYVTENSNLLSLNGLRRIWNDPTSSPQYYPMVFTSFWAEYRLWGLHPAGYHMVNVILHSLCGVLLFYNLKKLSVPFPLLASCIFVLHPVHVETVAWISERKNVLSAIFYLTSALVMLRCFRLDSPKVGDGKFSWNRYAIGLLFFICALLSKTVTCTLPAVFLLLIWWKRGKISTKEWVLLAPLFLVGLCAGIFTAYLERVHVGATGTSWELSIIERFMLAGRAILFYLGKLLWPNSLIFNYPKWQISQGDWTGYVFPIAVLSIFALMVGTMNKTGKGPLIGFSFFILTLFPALGFFNVYPFRYSYVADHFQYLASVGIFCVAAGMLDLLFRKVQRPLNIFVPLGSLVILLVLGAKVFSQARNYENIESLWVATISKNPSSFLAHNNLGLYLLDRGRNQEARGHFTQAAQIEPEFSEAFLNLGIAQAKLGNFAEATEYVSKAIEKDQQNFKAYYNLGLIQQILGKQQSALQSYESALSINPNYYKAHNNIGILMLRRNEVEKAAQHFQDAVKLNPRLAEAWFNLGNIMTRKKDYLVAAKYFSNAIQCRPDYGDAYYHMGIVAERSGATAEALKNYKIALKLKPELAREPFNLSDLIKSIETQ